MLGSSAWGSLLYMWDILETLCEQFKAHLPRNNAALGLRHVPHAPVCVQFCLSASHRGIWDQLHGLRPSWALDTPTLRALSACTTLPDSTVALSECALSQGRQSAKRASQRAGRETRAFMHEPIGESYPNGLWELGCSYYARGAT